MRRFSRFVISKNLYFSHRDKNKSIGVLIIISESLHVSCHDLQLIQDFSSINLSMMQPGRSYSTNKTFQLPTELDAKRLNDKKIYVKKNSTSQGAD